MTQQVKNPSAMQKTQEMWVQSSSWEDPLEKEMETHSSILAWEIPWTEEPGGLQSMGSQSKEIARVEKIFWSELRIPGDADTLNIELEKALRLLDFIEIGKLMAYDALNREESCGGHFREEHQTEEGEAKRDDENFSYVACWKYTGEGQEPELLKEDLNYQYIKVQQRNYKN